MVRRHFDISHVAAAAGGYTYQHENTFIQLLETIIVKYIIKKYIKTIMILMISEGEKVQ